jgi:hypothetical protein
MLFKAALALFKISEKEILKANDYENIFLEITNSPKKAVNAQEFIDLCFYPWNKTSVSRKRIKFLRQEYFQSIYRQKCAELESSKGNYKMKNQDSPDTNESQQMTPINDDQTYQKEVFLIKINKDTFENFQIQENYISVSSEINRMRRESTRRVVVGGQLFMVFDKNDSVFLRINYLKLRLEYTSLVSGQLSTIPKEKLISIEYGPNLNISPKCHATFEEISLTFTIIHSSGILTLISASKEVYIRWVDELNRFMISKL